MFSLRTEKWLETAVYAQKCGLRQLAKNDMICRCALECWWRLIRLTRRNHVTMSESSSAWPELPVAQWVDTRDALQLMTQVVGKVRLAIHAADEPLVERRAVDHWPDPVCRQRVFD
jgi:hypothetical protein